MKIPFSIFAKMRKFTEFHDIFENVTQISLVKFSRKNKYNSVHNPLLFDGKGQLGQDNWPGQLRQDTLIGQLWTGESGHDSPDRIARAGQLGQVSLDMLAGKVSRDNIVSRGWPEHVSKDLAETGGTGQLVGQPAQDS